MVFSTIRAVHQYGLLRARSMPRLLMFDLNESPLLGGLDPAVSAGRCIRNVVRAVRSELSFLVCADATRKMVSMKLVSWMCVALSVIALAEAKPEVSGQHHPHLFFITPTVRPPPSPPHSTDFKQPELHHLKNLQDIYMVELLLRSMTFLTEQVGKLWVLNIEWTNFCVLFHLNVGVS